MVITFKKSLLKSKYAKRIVRDAKLTYFKEKILEHLEGLEKKEKKKEEAIQKAFACAEELIKAGFPVGTVREWKGKKYMKIAPGKWRRKFDGSTRGTKQSFAAIKRKVDACTSAGELLQVVKENKHRFTDTSGQYLPIVKELFSHVSEAHKKIKGGGKAAADGDDKGLTSKQSANLKKITAILDKNIEEAPERIEFSKENFERLFKNGIDSPVEHIKIGKNQYEKLIAKNRQGLLAVMADVMKDPAIVMKTTDNAKLYVKAYSNMKNGRAVVSVVVDKENVHVSVSTHMERNKQLAKKMDSILYEKKRTESVHGDNTPHGTSVPTAFSITQPTDSVNREAENSAQGARWVKNSATGDLIPTGRSQKDLEDFLIEQTKKYYNPNEFSAKIREHGKNEKYYQNRLNNALKIRDKLVQGLVPDEEVEDKLNELSDKLGHLGVQLYLQKFANFANNLQVYLSALKRST